MNHRMNVSQHTVRTVLTKWQMKESRGHSYIHDPDDGFGDHNGGAFRVVPPHNDPVEELPTLAERGPPWWYSPCRGRSPQTPRSKPPDGDDVVFKQLPIKMRRYIIMRELFCVI